MLYLRAPTIANFMIYFMPSIKENMVYVVFPMSIFLITPSGGNFVNLSEFVCLTLSFSLVFSILKKLLALGRSNLIKLHRQLAPCFFNACSKRFHEFRFYS